MKKRLFIILFFAGFVGIVSFLLIDIEGLLSILPLPAGTEVPPMPIWMIKGLGLIQPTVILAIAVLIGIALAPKVGLSAPVAEALAEKGDWLAALRAHILPGIIGGIVGGVLIVMSADVWKPFLPADAVVLIGKFGVVMPLATRLLYGGITEEILLRWGFMTLLVWLFRRLFQKGEGKPKAVWFAAAILFSALIFGIGHLPVAFLLFPEPGAAIISFVIVANSLFGLVAGILYWKRGLESAIIAHAVTHIVLYTASRLGTYF